MSEPFIKSSFSAGEVSPQLYGRTDLAKWHAGCSVARNMFVNYKGGLSSRAGTALAGMCKQPASASSIPPRLIRFKFSLTQSYELEFGDSYMRVVANGAYVTESAFNVTAATQANPLQLTAPGNNFANGDWVFASNFGGMTQVDAETFIVANLVGNHFTLTDTFGNPVDSRNFGVYTGGGTIARIYTLSTPYLAVDLPYMKFVQSADVLSITLVNQQTLVDYAPRDLTRLSANNWTLTPTTYAASIGPPTLPTAATSGGTGATTTYSYVVTAVDAVTGQESVASAIASTAMAGDISLSFGTVTVAWTAPASGTVASYNIYKSAPSYTNPAVSPTGQLFGYVGTTTAALTWQDTNIIPDFVTTPPLAINPFPSAGNYPGVVAYFQQRRAYAYTVNAPDTYQMSQPGAYTNFDTADPPVDSDALTGTPWAQQVNGIQWMIPMPGGLIVGTGEDAWQVSGTGGAASPITPAQQSAQRQESRGFAATVQPITIGPNILYVQALGSTVRDMQYNFYANIYAGQDITVLSSHLFDDHQIIQWAWAQEPYKLVWACRDDGKMLSLAYIKDEEVTGWSRHDTNGLAVSVSTATEPPVDAVYWIVKRYIVGKAQWAYFVERMDNRLWQGVEDVWAVDCGLSLAQPTPNATVSASTATLLGGISGGNVIQGGSNYTAPAGTIIDPTGQGSGAVVAFTLSAGAIAAMTCSPEGESYQPGSYVEITDATGSGAIISLNFDNPVTFTASAPVFSAANVGNVIRMGGGIATITSVPNPSTAIAQLATAITTTIPNDPNNLPVPAVPGAWTMTAPITSVSGINHLEGMTVTGLMDGSVIPPTVVSQGTIALPAAATQVTVGLPFTPQGQTLHADLPGQMIQGKAKKVSAVTLRVEKTRGVKVGQDQPIAATAANQAETPWGQSPYGALAEYNDRSYGNIGANTAYAGAALPLFTGDIYVPITTSDWNTPDGQRSPGMVAFQQDYPLPLNVTACIPWLNVGDTNG